MSNNSHKTTSLLKQFEELNKLKESSDISRDFNEKEGAYKIAQKRLEIASNAIGKIAGLLLLSLVVLLVINTENKGDIIANYITSLFSIMTLIIGFVAGSSIDRK